MRGILRREVTSSGEAVFSTNGVKRMGRHTDLRDQLLTTGDRESADGRQPSAQAVPTVIIGVFSSGKIWLETAQSPSAQTDRRHSISKFSNLFLKKSSNYV
jgi:hypothetical protein